MLFRWGGDEFMVLMFKLDEQESRRRMETLNEILEANSAQWISVPTTISVSVGVCGFASMNDLGVAIDNADRAMYENKQKRRARMIRSEPTAVAGG